MNSCENLICKRKNIALIRHNYIIKYLPLFAGIHFIFISHNKNSGYIKQQAGPHPNSFCAPRSRRQYTCNSGFAALFHCFPLKAPMLHLKF